MGIDAWETLGIFGGEAAKHPQTTGLLMQTYSLWNNHSEELKKVLSEYQNTNAQAKGPIDTGGIVLQLMAMHPFAKDLLKQTLVMWQTRIPDLIQILDELQNAANEAAKT